MLTLNKRPCRLGTSINTRRELHGDEPVPAMDIPLVNILLNAEELNTLLDEPLAHAALFNTSPLASKPATPLFHEKFKAFAMRGKFKGAAVAVHLGLKPDVILLENVKLAKLKLVPQIGGLTALSVTVQASGETAQLSHLLDFLDNSADVAIEFSEAITEEGAEEEQPELDLEPA